MKLMEGFDSNYRYILVAARRARLRERGVPDTTIDGEKAAIVGELPVWAMFALAAVYWGAGMGTSAAWSTWCSVAPRESSSAAMRSQRSFSSFNSAWISSTDGERRNALVPAL